MNVHTYDYWSDEKKLKASKLWAEGLSASQIAERMGIGSRSAVIGIAYRNRKLFPKRKIVAPRSNVPEPLSRRRPNRRFSLPAPKQSNDPIIFKTRKVKGTFEIKSGRVKPPTPPVDEWSPYDAGSHHKPLIDLKALECRWPVGHDTRGHLFCSHEALGPYCDHHKARSVGRGTISEQSAISDARRKA